MADTHADALQLRIIGDIEPLRLRAHDLGEIISSYEDALAAVVARRHPTLKPETITVGLVSVDEGSVALAFDAPLPEFVYPAALEVTRAIASQAWADLPLRAVKPIRKIVQFLRQRNLTAQFHTVVGADAASAVITKDTNIPPAVTLYGQTEIIAEVKRVGGKEPRAMLETLQGDTLYCVTTAEIAKQLGNYLYQQVRVSGAAEWDFETLALAEFEIAAVLPYQRTSPTKAFAAVREQFGAHFDQIDDPNAWASQVRQG